VLVEKVVPYPRAVSYAAGAALIAMGVLGMFPSWLAGHWR
jgi:hypothetical protein